MNVLPLRTRGTLHASKGYAYVTRLHLPRSLARYERCLHLDPKSPWRTCVWPSMAGCLVAMGRFDEAIVLAKEGLQIGTNNHWVAANLIAALAHSGRIVKARAALAQFDPRQAGVFKTSQFGPKLTGLSDEALQLAELNC